MTAVPRSARTCCSSPWAEALRGSTQLSGHQDDLSDLGAALSEQVMSDSKPSPIPPRTDASQLACVEGVSQRYESIHNDCVTHAVAELEGNLRGLVPGALGVREGLDKSVDDNIVVVVCGYYWDNGACTVLVVLTVQSKRGFIEMMGWAGVEPREGKSGSVLRQQRHEVAQLNRGIYTLFHAERHKRASCCGCRRTCPHMHLPSAAQAHTPRHAAL